MVPKLTHRHTPMSTSFLTCNVTEQEIFVPESIIAEQQQLADFASSFLSREVLPALEGIEYEESTIMRHLILKAGESHLLGGDVPERYGGLGMGLKIGVILSDRLASEHSFLVSWGVQTGIAILPIIYFGSEALKATYLPAMVAGKKIGAFAVTEAEAGSDVMANKTWAKLSADGQHYVLNGSKKWITNAGIADLFCVFARVDSTKFTVFVVEAEWEGVSIGPEERKMGIPGSSHCEVYFQDVKIPVGNVLWEVGKGPKIVFSVLAAGRMKMAAGCVGVCKEVLAVSTHYTAERRTFGKTLHHFGLIQKKLAIMAIETYAAESMTFRSIGLLDERLDELTRQGTTEMSVLQAAIEEYTVESSIVKVFASEVSNRVADEGLQIFGGYGYIQGHPVERAYRDSRITRIYEGTNEINRLLIAGTMLRLNLSTLLTLVPGIEEQITHSTYHAPAVPQELVSAVNVLERAKRAAIYTLVKAVTAVMATIEQEQEVLEYLSNVLIFVYAIDSALARALLALHHNNKQAQTHVLLANLVTWHYLSPLRDAIDALLYVAFQEQKLIDERRQIHDFIGIHHIRPIETQRSLAEIIQTMQGYPLW